MRLNARVDSNQAEIVAALRARGWTVLHLHTLGRGAPDLCVGTSRGNVLLEVKSKGGKLTQAEKVFAAQWLGPLYTVYSPEEAIEASS